LFADSAIYYEYWLSAKAPYKPISVFADCIFFNGLTLYNNNGGFIMVEVILCLFNECRV